MSLMQRGVIYRHHGACFLRYYDVGSPRRRRAVRLAPANRDYPNKRSVLLLAEKILAPINSGRLQPESATPVSEFIEKFYLPHAERTLRPSTLKDYREIFHKHLRDRLGNTRLRDFRTVHGQRIMASVSGVGHTRLLRIKSFLSGVFTFALREGWLDGVNPMRPVSVAGRPSHFKGAAYAIDEIEQMLIYLSEPARTVVAVAAFDILDGGSEAL